MTTKIELKSAWNGKEIKIQGKKVVGKTAYEIGLVVEGQAKLLAPRDTGHLAASITTQAIDKGTELDNPNSYMVENHSKLWKTNDTWRKIEKPTDSNEVLVGTALDYAPYIEFGTVKMNAQPFLRPALDLAKGKALTIVKRNVRFEFKDYIK